MMDTIFIILFVLGIVAFFARTSFLVYLRLSWPETYRAIGSPGIRITASPFLSRKVFAIYRQFPPAWKVVFIGAAFCEIAFMFFLLFAIIMTFVNLSNK